MRKRPNRQSLVFVVFSDEHQVLQPTLDNSMLQLNSLQQQKSTSMKAFKGTYWAFQAEMTAETRALCHTSEVISSQDFCCQILSTKNSCCNLHTELWQLHRFKVKCALCCPSRPYSVTREQEVFVTRPTNCSHTSTRRMTRV